MAYNFAKRIWYDWRRHHNIVQSVNFVLGLILVITTLVFLLVGERLGSNDSQMNTYILGFCGVLALWAGVTNNERSVYVIDMLLGLIFISSSTSLAILNDEAIRADVIIGTLTGLVFLITAYGARNLWKGSRIKKNELIEDFEP